MFTQLKKGNWNYMLLTAISCIAVAALVSLFSSRPEAKSNSHASHNSEQIITGRYIQHNETTLRFIN